MIRFATSQDISVLAGFQVAMALESEGMILDTHTVTNGVRAVLEDPLKGQYYVIEEDGRVCACLMITLEWSEWRCKWVWWIQSVYVIPEKRGMGYYSKLYKHIQSLAIQAGNVSGIRLYADKTNTRAMAVYRKLGMTDQHYSTFEWMLD